MERAFSSDFAAVRVHTGVTAHDVASVLGARALTVGTDILFSPGTYRPGTPGGDRLLAHELAHVVQQSHGLPRGILDSGASDPLERAARLAADYADPAAEREARGAAMVAADGGYVPALSRQPLTIARQDLDAGVGSGTDTGVDSGTDAGVDSGTDAGVDPGSGAQAGAASAADSAVPGCPPSPNCPEGFCKPQNRLLAMLERQQTSDIILAGIAAAVSVRVLSVWSEYIWGGTSTVQDLSAQFGQDFTNDATTIRVTNLLVTALTNDLNASPPAFPVGANSITVDIHNVGPQTNAMLAALGDATSPNKMRFTELIPGNLAGGIDKDQDNPACGAGAHPSSRPDNRRATGTITITQGPAMLVEPSIMYIVDDTIDFCPGNCGTGLITHVVTTTLSQWEATGISGDVPFTVQFPAPVNQFVIPNASGP